MPEPYIDKMNRIIDRNGNHIGYVFNFAMTPEQVARLTEFMKSWELPSDKEHGHLDFHTDWEFWPYKPEKKGKPMFNLFKSETDGQWYWNVKARNGKIICQSEGYKTKAGANKGFRSLCATLDQQGYIL